MKTRFAWIASLALLLSPLASHATAEFAWLCREALTNTTDLAEIDQTGFGLTAKRSDKPQWITRDGWVLLSDARYYANQLAEAKEKLKDYEERKKPLKPITIERQKQKVEGLTADTAEARKAWIKHATAVERPLLIEKLRRIAEDRSRHALLAEATLAERIGQLDAGKLVSIVVGNPKDTLDPRVVDQVLSLALEAVNGGRGVIYNSDSQYRALFEMVEASHPGMTLGIGAADLPNDYLRMEAFGHPKHVFTFESSATGTAVLYRGNSTVHFSETSALETPINFAAEWKAGLDKMDFNLGVRPYPTLFRSVRSREVLTPEALEGKLAFTGFPASLRERELTFSELSWAGLMAVLDYVQVMPSARAAMQAENPTGGVAVFGSASSEIAGYINQWAYDAVTAIAKLGAPITTGGAGGFMRLANTAAFEAGAPSIGIPIGGRNQLNTETRVFHKVQTLTINTPDYSSRIPMLLQDQKWVVFLPGGNGTVKELATTISQMIAQYGRGEEMPRIAFLGQQYWGPIYREFRRSNLPKAITDRLFMANEGSELVTLFRNHTPEWLTTLQPPTPRRVTPKQKEFLRNE